MEIIGDLGAKALCHGEHCLQLDDRQLDHLKTLNVRQAWGYLTREVGPNLSKKERAILDQWQQDNVDLSPVCSPTHQPPPKIIRKGD